MSDRRSEALRELMESSGFALLKAEAEAQYGDGGAFRILKRALSHLPTGDTVAHEDALAQVVAVQTAIESLLTWPKREFDRLQSDVAKDEAPVPIVPRRVGGNR